MEFNAPASGNRSAAPSVRVVNPVSSAQRLDAALLPALAALTLATAVLLGGLTGCSKGEDKDSPAAQAKKTGTIAVKTNIEGVTLEALQQSPADGAKPDSATAPAGQPLVGLNPGNYIVTARADGWPETTAQATVTAGQTTEVTLAFKSGSLRIDTEPSGATVRLGTTTFGQTPLLIPRLPVGEPTLQLEFETWPAFAYRATITENGEANATVRIPHGKVVVQTSPAGATVRMDGKTMGQSPLTIERASAGKKKLVVHAKDFPSLEVVANVEDRGEAKIDLQLGAYFPPLNPEDLLRAVWVQTDAGDLAPSFDINGPYQPQNGIVKNLHRKNLYERFLQKSYNYTGVVKDYDRKKGEIEFVEESSRLSRYRIIARLSPEAQDNKPAVDRLVKGAKLGAYGRLTAVEEPRWPAKVITFELTAADVIRPAEPAK